MPLPVALQDPFDRIFARVLNDATLTAPSAARGPHEVGWLEHFHALAALNLPGDISAALRAGGSSYSVAVDTAFVHGTSFVIEAVPPITAKGIEAGDLLVVGEMRDSSGGVATREALLLQMKVGSHSSTSGTSSTAQQAAFYGAWPEVLWRGAALRDLPGPHPRTPAPGPCRASQFGIVPQYADWRTGIDCRAFPLTGPGTFGSPKPLSSELATTVRLALGIDATPGPADGWPRIVEDLLTVASSLTFAGRIRRHSGSGLRTPGPNVGGRSGAAAGPPTATPPQPDPGGGALVVIRVAFGPQGVLD